MSISANQRVLHLVRHAQSEFNTFVNHQIEGFFAGMTILDAKLTQHGKNQCLQLREKIENDQNAQTNPFHIKNAQLVISSPLSRALHTAQLSMPMSKYKYMIRAEITEQIENTSDIGYDKTKLLEMYPELSNTIGISQLPEAWWWRHPTRWSKDINISPHQDALLLHKYNGKLPAAESKYMVRKRCQYFLKWLYSTINQDSNRLNEFMPQILDNIAIFSHSCTIKEFELILLTIENKKELNKDFENNFNFRKNTEVVSYQLPKNSNEIDWELVQYTVDKSKGELNHADTIGVDININGDGVESDIDREERYLEYATNIFVGGGYDDINYEDPLTKHLKEQEPMAV